MLYLSGVVRPDMPAMLTPDIGNRIPEEQQWAADNGCFTQPKRYSDERYLAWLVKQTYALDRCLFATAPDVVGDAVATLARSMPMLPRIREAGYPAALVAQDGLTPDMVPWDDIDALFIGGTTEFKESEAAFSLCQEARARGKWVHMGRVNSAKRLRYAHEIGCDSADGTFISFAPTENLGRMLAWLDKLHPTLEGIY